MKESASLIKTLRTFFCFLTLTFLLISTVQAGTYAENLRYDLKRGLKNTLGAPVEIPLTIQDYHERAGWPYVRQGIGFFVGTGKMLVRLGSGLVDFGAAWIPGLQKGFPVDPETLF